MSEVDPKPGWQARELKLRTKLEESREYYTSRAKSARLMHRALSLVVLIGAILAPATVATGAAGGNLTVLGLTPQAISGLSLVITLVVALAEGVRRMFWFDHRWEFCSRTGRQLYNAREKFRDGVVDLDRGSDEWKKAYFELRETYEELTAKEAEEFFGVVRTTSGPESPGKIKV